MRHLQLLIRRRTCALPLLVSATLLPGAACEGECDRNTQPPPDAGGGTRSDASVYRASGGMASGGQSVNIDAATGGAAEDAGPCVGYQQLITTTLPLPNPGVRATLGELCAYEASPLPSPGAAEVTLLTVPGQPRKLRGSIELVAELADNVTGLPALSVESPSGTYSAALTSIERTGSTISFELEFNYPLDRAELGFWLNVALELACGPADAGAGGSGGASATGVTWRLVNARSYWENCIVDGQLVWRSSGDLCGRCEATICEMVPSPVAPTEAALDLPLGDAPSPTLRVIARVGAALVVLCEHDRGPEKVDYAWQVSGGELRELAPDLVLWNPPEQPGTHLLQVCLETPTGLGLASLRHSGVA